MPDNLHINNRPVTQFLVGRWGDSHNNWQGKENLPHMCAYKNIGQEESILLLLFLPDGVLWSCLHAVSVSELSVDFVFFLLARHSPSKLGLCSCFGSSVILRTELSNHLCCAPHL